MTGTGTRNRGTSTRRSPGAKAARRGSLGKNARKWKGISWRARLAVAGGVIAIVVTVWAIVDRQGAPTSNTSLTRFDAIIVLGSPADDDGNPTPMQLARVIEGVREYERGVAPRLILTGGASHRHFVEAKVMARTAQAQGIPESAIFVEDEAEDTIQNACYSERIMRKHGWESAEVVSSEFHLPRTAMILERLPIQWRVHAAPPLEPQSAIRTGFYNVSETLKTVRYLVWAREMERCEP